MNDDDLFEKTEEKNYHSVWHYINDSADLDKKEICFGTGFVLKEVNNLKQIESKSYRKLDYL